MPALTVNAELVPSDGGPRVVVFVDGHRAAHMGPFETWPLAHEAAELFRVRAAAAITELLESVRKR